MVRWWGDGGASSSQAPCGEGRGTTPTDTLAAVAFVKAGRMNKDMKQKRYLRLIEKATEIALELYAPALKELAKH